MCSRQPEAWEATSNQYQGLEPGEPSTSGRGTERHRRPQGSDLSEDQRSAVMELYLPEHVRHLHPGEERAPWYA